MSRRAMALCCLAPMCIFLAMGLFGLLLIPSVESEVVRLSNTHLTGRALGVANTVILVRHFCFCLGDYLGCMKNLAIDDLVSVYGCEAGVGSAPLLSLGVPEAHVHA